MKLFAVVALMVAAALAAPVHAAPEGPQVIALTRQPDGNLTVTGRIGASSGTFLFDSGWGVSAVTPVMAGRIGCTPWGKLVGFRAIGERIDSQQCQPAVLTVAGIAMPLPTVALVDLQRFMPPGSPVFAGALGLDAFAGRSVTIRRRAGQIVVETPRSLAARVATAKAVPVRLVRDSQGAALTVDLGLPTTNGMLWMELDTANLGGTMIGRHAAPLLGLNADRAKDHGQRLTMRVADGIAFSGPVQVLDLIMDGLLGADFLDQWDLTLDLKNGRGWLAPSAGAASGDS